MRNVGQTKMEVSLEQKSNEFNAATTEALICSAREYVMCCAIWCHLYNLKNLKNTHGGQLLLVKSLLACCVTKSNPPPWSFFTFFKLCK